MRDLTPVLAVFLAGLVFFALELHLALVFTFAAGSVAAVFLGVIVVAQLVLLGAYLAVGFLPPPTLRFAPVVLAGAGTVVALALGPAPAADLPGALLRAVPLLFVALAAGMILPGSLRGGSTQRTAFPLLTVSNAGAALGLLASGLVLSGQLPELRTGLLAGLAVLAGALHARNPAGSRPPVLSSGGARRIIFFSSGLATLWYMTVHERTETLLPAVPELWVASLLIFLASYAIALKIGNKYGIAVVVAVAATLGANFAGGPWAGVLALTGMLAGCLAANATLRDALDRHGGYRGALVAAAGGLSGGLVAAIVAPLTVSTTVQLILVVGALVLVVVGPRPRGLALVTLALVVSAGTLHLAEARRSGERTATMRTLYGEYEGREYGAARSAQHHRVFFHRGTVHGAQYTDERVNDLPVSYYSNFSGIGLAIEALRTGKPLDIGVVGLGAGGLAVHGEPGDRITFLEIDPAIEGFIDELGFTQLDQSPAEVAIKTGDGRKLLEESDQRHDMLVIDAFSGGNVPAHLITREAFQLYDQRVEPDGVLAFHISNRYLDLRPAVYAGARAIGRRAVLAQARARVAREGEAPSHASMLSNWIIVSSDEGFWRRFAAASRELRQSGQITMQDSRAVAFDGYGDFRDGAFLGWPLLFDVVASRERETGWRPGR
jgi:spermidine synthase